MHAEDFREYAERGDNTFVPMQTSLKLVYSELTSPYNTGFMLYNAVCFYYIL